MPLADTQAIAFLVSRPPSTIRTWAHRGLLQRRGTGPRKCALYDTDEALELMNAIEQVAQVRELHKPRWHDPYTRSGQVWLVCHGCDEGPHAEGAAFWPCSTAQIVYTATEIKAREPHITECSVGHGITSAGYPVQSPAVFIKTPEGKLMARRHGCGHVQPVPVETADLWE